MIVEQLKNTPEELVFSKVITYIDEHYEFTPTKFTNERIVRIETLLRQADDFFHPNR